MSILISDRLSEMLAKAPRSVQASLSEAVRLLHGVTPENVERRAKWLAGRKPSLYVIRAGKMRYIFSFQGEAIVLLAMTTGDERNLEVGYVDRFRLMTKDDQAEEIDDKIGGTFHQLVDSEEVAGAIATTNAFGWMSDTYEVESYDIEQEKIRVKISWSAVGEQDDDRTYHGDKLNGSAVAVIDQQGEVSYEDVGASVEDLNGERPEE